jgi:hypothetical protein
VAVSSGNGVREDVFPAKNTDRIIIDLNAVDHGQEISPPCFDVAVIKLALHQV